MKIANGGLFHIYGVFSVCILMTLSFIGVSYIYASREDNFVAVEDLTEFFPQESAVSDLCGANWNAYVQGEQEKTRVAGILQNDKSFIEENGSRSYRNNNPGNLKFVGQKGAIGKDENGFAIFATYEDGRQAHIRQIETDAGRGKNLRDFIRKFAPNSSNNADYYAEFVARRFPGASLETPISELDPETLQTAMQKIEGWIEPKNKKAVVVENPVTIAENEIKQSPCFHLEDVKKRLQCIRAERQGS